MFFNWTNQRVVVTGGTGILGSHVCDALAKRNPAAHVAIGSINYALCWADHIRKILSELRPNLVMHLVAKVGGIGANREHPASRKPVWTAGPF